MTDVITTTPQGLAIPYELPERITAVPVATAALAAAGYTPPQPDATTDAEYLLGLVQDLPCAGWVGIEPMSKGGPWVGTSAAPVALDGHLKARVTKEQPPLNLGIVAGNGLIVVDCDTAADVDYFKRLCFGLAGVVPRVTVTTPGVQAEDGNAKVGHTGGAHFYLRCIKERGPWGPKSYGYPDEYYAEDGTCLLPKKITKRPDATDPSRATADNPDGRTALDVRFHGAYTLCPPSQRPEGRYVPHVTSNGKLAVTDVYPAFIERLLHYTEYRAELPQLVPCPSNRIGLTPAIVPGNGWTAEQCSAAGRFGEALGVQLWAMTHPEDTTATITGYDGTTYAPSEIGKAYPGYFTEPHAYAAGQGGLLAAADVVIPSEAPSPGQGQTTDTTATGTIPDDVLREAAAADREVCNNPEDAYYTRVTPWEDLLEEWGYTRYHHNASCGCELWCRPGGASDYQMVCHSEDCTKGLKFGYSYSPIVPDEWREFARRDDGAGVLVTKIDLLHAAEGTTRGNEIITDTYANTLPGYASPERLAAEVGADAARDILAAIDASTDALPLAEDTTTASAQHEDTTAATPQHVDTTGTTAEGMGTPLGTGTTPSAPLPAAPVLTLVEDTAEDDDEDDAITTLMQDYDPADTITPRPRGCRVYAPEDTERTGDGSVALTTAQAATVLEIITEARDYLSTGDTAAAGLCGDGPKPIPPRLVHTVAKAVAAGEAAPSDRETFPDGPPNDLALVNRIMNFSPVTQAIYTHGTGAGGIGHPVAAYLHQLVLTCMRIPPYLRTPTGNGTDKKPIALYVQLMGPSGAGKSVTMAQPWLWARTGETRHWFNERPEDSDCTLMQDTYLDAVAPDRAAEVERDFIRPSNKGEEEAHRNRSTPAQRHTMGAYRGIKSVAYDPDTQTPPDLGRYIEANSDAAVTDPLVHTKRIITTPKDKDGNLAEEITEVTALRPRAVALARYDEMGKVFNKNGSSPVLDELAKAWSGTWLGGTTQGHGNKQVDGVYSYNLEGGVQPSLLAEFATPAAMRGFMQRQFFCYAAWPFGDLDIGITPQHKLPPSPLETTPDLAPFTAVPAVGRAKGNNALRGEKVNDVNRNEDNIWLRGMPEHVYDMMSHATLIAVRLACAVAALHGVSHVSDAIWNHTKDLMEFHRRSLRAFVAQGDAAAEADKSHHGRLAGVAEVARDRYKKEAADAATKHRKSVLNELAKTPGKWVRESRILRGCTPGTESYAHRVEALDALADRGIILAEVNPHSPKGAMRYKVNPTRGKGKDTTA